MTLVMTESGSDIRLVEEARSGSAAAFATIVERYHERLYAVVVRIVHDRADAEEVTQETFLRAYRNLASFHLDSALYTWLYRIAVNAAVDLAKKRRRRQHLSLDDEELVLDGALPAAGQDPGEEYERAELVQLVREGIEALPERYRVILLLREYSDMSYESLAEVLELPKGTVESRLFRARMKLKDWLQRRLGEDGLDGCLGLLQR
jgi:RNA polymerase sigma-70 factor (ECF subfamily)